MERIYGARHDDGRHYVDVVTLTAADGLVTPLEIRWDDGRRFRIDGVTCRRRSHSLKRGGAGMRYTILVGPRSTYLYYDADCKAWYVEAKDRAE